MWTQENVTPERPIITLGVRRITNTPAFRPGMKRTLSGFTARRHRLHPAFGGGKSVARIQGTAAGMQGTAAGMQGTAAGRPRARAHALVGRFVVTRAGCRSFAYPGLTRGMAAPILILSAFGCHDRSSRRRTSGFSNYLVRAGRIAGHHFNRHVAVFIRSAHLIRDRARRRDL